MALLTHVFKELFSSRKDATQSVERAAIVHKIDEEFDRHRGMAMRAFPGATYYDFLKWFHGYLKPETYVEIGIETGKTMSLANSETIAIGVDPDYRIVYDIHSRSSLFKIPSDDFFRDHDVPKILANKKVDFAFIDGLHTFDQALKDFMNIERLARPDSVIVFHDVYPVAPETADRDRHTTFWIGDTWKVMVILKKFRPDLKIFTIPTFPSGLGVVTGLNPASTVLDEKYDAIVSEAMTYDLEPYLETIRETLSVVENSFEAVASRLKVNRVSEELEA